MTSTTTAGLEREYQRLVELNRSRDRFLRTVSHELRTPLTAILSCTDLLGDERTGPLTDDQREYVDIVGRSAGRLLSLVEDLLELAGLESGRLVPARELLDLPAVLAAAAESRRPSLTAAGLDLGLDLEPGPPVRGDAGRVRRVVEGLLRNAGQHTPAGGRVALAARPVDAGWEVTVTDTGAGIPGAEQRGVFDALSRGPAALDGRSGPGLGLAIGRAVAELHGGTLTLTSEPGRGTAVTLRLPYAYGEPDRD